MYWASRKDATPWRSCRAEPTCLGRCQELLCGDGSRGNRQWDDRVIAMGALSPDTGYDTCQGPWQSQCATRLAVGNLQKLTRSTHTKGSQKWACWGDEPWKAREPELRPSVNTYQVNPVGQALWSFIHLITVNKTWPCPSGICKLWLWNKETDF